MDSKILFVDDEEIVLRAISRDLQGEPYQVLVATSAEQAMRALSDHKIKVVVADQRMPRCSGLELLSRIRAEHPDVIRVILTGQADMATVIRAINEGHVYYFLTKPWERHELKSAVNRALAHADRLLEAKTTTQFPTALSVDTLETLEESYPGISRVKRTRDGAIEIDVDELEIQ
jgi:DNA-binding NtrC family response regulator